MHNMTNTVTYLTDTNHDPHTHYILDEHDMGSDIISVIKPLGCKIKDERR